MLRKHLLILVTLLTFSLSAQTREIKGIVLDAESEMPLIGSTIAVTVKNLDEVGISKFPFGTISDLDGRFTLSIPENLKHVTVSFLGYLTQKINVSGDFETIRLAEDKKELETVVVTGYRNIQKRKLTASVAKINADELTGGGTMSIDQMLEGQLAGVSSQMTSGAPGSSPKIRIRGTSSLNGTQDPLWVIDGFPIEGSDLPSIESNDIDQLYSSSIAGLNPSDIASITVLKDAAATAIYGARAANGVIVITTKNGKEGKAVINFSSKTFFALKPDISKQNLMNSDQKVGLELDLLRSDYDYYSDKGEVARQLNSYGETEQYIKNGFGSLSPEAQNSINQLKNTNTDWNDLLFKETLNTDISLSISGGSAKSNYYVSLGYYNEQGSTIGTSANRMNITSKLNLHPVQKLKIGIAILANQRNNTSYLTNTDGFTNPAYYTKRANPYLQVSDNEGNYNYDPDIQGYGYNDELIKYNIYEERNNTSNDLSVNSINTIFDVNWDIYKGFSLSSQLGLQKDFYTGEQWSAEDSYATRKDIERSRLLSGSFLPSTGGIIKDTKQDQSQYNIKTMLKYDGSWNDKHELDILIGNEIRHTDYESTFSAAYGYDKQTLTSQPVIYPDESWANTFPLYSKNTVENAYVSLFSTLSYTLKQRYTLGASVRFDGSDLFGVDPKYRYLPLYSVSGLWRISEEHFMYGMSWLTNLDFRASYGLQGNIDKDTSPFVIGTWDQISLLPGTSQRSISVVSPPNERLRWEKTQNTNFGINVALFNYAIALQADAYFRNSSDLIGTREVPYETGFQAVTENWAAMSNNGLELALNTRNISREHFTWETSFNFAYNYNKVTKVSVSDNQTTPSLEGYAADALFDYAYAGTDQQGYPLFYSKDGTKQTAVDFFGLTSGTGGVGTATTLSSKEQRDLYTYMGTTTPPYTGGLINKFKYKNWDLSVSIITNWGHKVQTSPYYSMTKYNRGHNAKAEILDRWTTTNTTSQLPRLISENTVGGTRQLEYNWLSDFNIDQSFDLWSREANEIRLQNVSLGYRLPNKITNRIGMQAVRFTFEARNLWIWGSDMDGYIDPVTMGNEYAQPIPKTFLFGLNIKI